MRARRTSEHWPGRTSACILLTSSTAWETLTMLCILFFNEDILILTIGLAPIREYQK